MSGTQPVHDQFITNYKGLNLYQIGYYNLTNFSQYVFQQYAYHFKKKHQWQPAVEDFLEIQQKDEADANHATYFAFKNAYQDIIGTIKTTLKNDQLTFPIETDFNISIPELIDAHNLDVSQVWHLGRFAVDTKTLRKNSLDISGKELMKQLLIHSFEEMYDEGYGLMVAESDVLIYSIFHELGINMQIVGEAKDYVGSPTYPVIVTGEDMADWLSKNALYEYDFAY